MPRIVIAVGGNAILPPGNNAVEEQEYNVQKITPHIVNLAKLGYDVILTHGNGPQVGNILLQNEWAREAVPANPMDVCVAESQGQIGYFLQQSIANELRAGNESRPVFALVSEVLVDARDEAFKNPTKPIGPYYRKRRAAHLMKKKGWIMKEDKVRGGFRRLVPSPLPLEVLEMEGIREYLRMKPRGKVIIVCGGGGIPVVKDGKRYEGVDAVIDKDRTASLLARELMAESLVLITDVDKVSLHWGTREQVDLDAITLADAKRYLNEDQFPPGSMGPKIGAAVEFLEAGGKRAIVCSLDGFPEAMEGRAGTTITP
ncbi:MAG: carbamate kinase [Thermoplasmata archaeon]|nr:carbamate kinase [Thermoplasmata archaeon]